MSLVIPNGAHINIGNTPITKANIGMLMYNLVEKYATHNPIRTPNMATDAQQRMTITITSRISDSGPPLLIKS